MTKPATIATRRNEGIENEAMNAQEIAMKEDTSPRIEREAPSRKVEDDTRTTIVRPSGVSEREKTGSAGIANEAPLPREDTRPNTTTLDEMRSPATIYAHITKKGPTGNEGDKIEAAKQEERCWTKVHDLQNETLSTPTVLPY